MGGVFLVILILFIVITPLEDRFEAGLPYAETADVLQNPFEAVAVRVQEDGFVLVEWQRVSELDVAEAISRRLRWKQKAWVVVSADSCVSYGAVNRVFGQLAAAGVTRITLRTSKTRTY